jgi:predicted glycosyltransferase involved in capsule biosynthesis
VTNDVAVFIPWRDSGVLERQRSMSYVKNYLETNLNTQVNFADGKGERFSLSAARNNAVSQAKAMGAGVAVICDADTILEIDSIIEAILHVKSFNSIVIPYKISRYLTENSSNAVLTKNSNPNDLEAIASFDWSVGGAIVTPVDEWERVGGQDERFTGWGCEDVAFMIAAEKMGNRPIKIDGVMNHLWHPSAEKSGEAYEYNAMLLQRYADTDNVELLIEEGKKGIR